MELQKLVQYDPSQVDVGYQYLDHTADVVLHSWGNTFNEAFEQACIALFNYMTPLQDIDLNAEEISTTINAEVTGTSDETLLWNFLNEALYLFGTQQFLVVKPKVVVLERRRSVSHPPEGDGDQESQRPTHYLKCSLRGVKWQDGKHRQGTEVKAITKHGLRIGFDEEDMRCHGYVVIDI